MKKGLKVLLALMKLDIGGAETHVVELAKELKKRGYDVVVTSGGGVYTEELLSFGIAHYTLPLYTKKPKDMIKSLKGLKKIIIDEKIELVHSHARIPSFLLGILQKRMHFPFATTAHWVFKTSFGLKYLTDWGEATVAVSEDIKKYLVDNYKTPEENIFVTINGIDTEKFSDNLDTKDVLSEFSIDENAETIVYISRMDEDRSLVAKQLIEAFPELSEKIDNLTLLIVGGGNDYENVKSLANNVNTNLNREAIKLTGPRTDIARLISPASLFVGVSRSALEAMAEEKAVIIAGNEGYIGLFDEELTDIGIKTNFCCRGCEPSSPKRLTEDILKFYSLSDDDKKRLGKYGRDLVLKNYSVSKMADDTEKAYNKVLEKN